MYSDIAYSISFDRRKGFFEITDVANPVDEK